MATRSIDLVDTKTEDENHQTEDPNPGILYDSTIVQKNLPKAQFGCKVCPKSFQLVTDLLKHFKVHVNPGSNQKEQQTFKDGTSNLKGENENNEMDIEGTVLKVELKPSLTQIQKPDGRHENANQEEHIVEIKTENQAHDQNQRRQSALSIEETIDIKLENEEIRLYICGKRLNSKEISSASKERSTKKSNVKVQNICQICNKSFSTKTYLKRHVTTVHDEVKEHKCEICSKTFGKNSELQFHVKTVHNSIKPHKCVTCDKSFGQLCNLKTHERIHNGEKPYECKTCNKAFREIGKLKVHERIHTGAKPFECKICKKTFSDPSNLIIHEKIHTGTKPFECQTCKKTFS